MSSSFLADKVLPHADLGLQVSSDASVLHRVLPEPAATS
jgi:hypothetical protein